MLLWQAINSWTISPAPHFQQMHMERWLSTEAWKSEFDLMSKTESTSSRILFVFPWGYKVEIFFAKKREPRIKSWWLLWLLWVHPQFGIILGSVWLVGAGRRLSSSETVLLFQDGFSSQHPQGSSQLPAIPVPGELMSSSDLCGNQARMW